MSESIDNMPAQETPYPPLSEASDNDVREAPVTEPVEEPAAEAPAEPQETASTEAPSHEVLDEDDAQARASKLARDLREQRRRNKQMELDLQALQGQRQETKDEAFQREVRAHAAQMAQQQVIAEKSNAIYTEGIKQFGKAEFDDSVRALNEAFGQQMHIVLDTIVDTQHAEKTIQYLADNPDMLDQMAALPAHKLGAAIERAALKANRPNKPISKAPPPIQPISTRSTSEPELNMEDMSMDQLAALWDKRDFIRRMGG